MKRRHILARQCCTGPRPREAPTRPATGSPRQGLVLVLRSQAGPQGNFIQFSSAKGSWTWDTCKGQTGQRTTRHGSQRLVKARKHQEDSPTSPSHNLDPRGAGRSHLANHPSTGSDQPTQPKWFKTQKKPGCVTKAIFNPRLFVPDASLKW